MRSFDSIEKYCSRSSGVALLESLVVFASGALIASGTGALLLWGATGLTYYFVNRYKK